jgi:hypothetical protein
MADGAPERDEYALRFGIYRALFRLLRAVGEVGEPWPALRARLARELRALLALVEGEDG